MTPKSTADSLAADAASHRTARRGTRAARRAASALLAVIVIGFAGSTTEAENPRVDSPLKSNRSAESVAGAAEVLANPTSIKLRRLHLVRPDLLPYPIQLDVYC